MSKTNFDLEERTSIFSEKVVELCREARKTLLAVPIADQLIRSGTSIGANYCEANGASSKKDFTNKIFICKKEAKETQYWLRIMAKTVPELTEKCRVSWQEARELGMIFSSIARKSKV